MVDKRSHHWGEDAAAADVTPTDGFTRGRLWNIDLTRACVRRHAEAATYADGGVQGRVDGHDIR